MCVCVDDLCTPKPYLAGVCTYVNIICINVIGVLLSFEGLEPDSGMVVWERRQVGEENRW